jgi:hypothetical protein
MRAKPMGTGLGGAVNDTANKHRPLSALLRAIRANISVPSQEIATRTHAQIDQLNLELGRAVATKLRRQPELFDNVVRRRLRRWRISIESGDTSSRQYLEEWEKLAADGLETCLARLTEQSEKSTALRQSSPFAGVLTSSERMRIIRAWRATNEARRP